MQGLPVLPSVVALVVSTAASLGQEPTRPRDLWRFTPESAAWEKDYEARFRGLLSPKRVEEHLRLLSARPHLTGSEGARLTADYLHERLEEYGLDVETVRYDGLLPAPVSSFVELVAPLRQTLPSVERPIAGDPYTEHAEEHPGWNGYSPSGEATGEVVYAHFGSEKDLSSLKEMGVDLRGKILLMRYFGTGEGRKVRNAERFGAAGVVLYADPQEDGYRYGDVYPKGNWRPPGAIMRRSIAFLPYEGDPLSPGWASVPGAKRLKPEDVALPRIPVLPISYGSAERVLHHLAGPVAASGWQGALPLTYRVGPGPAKLHIRAKTDLRDRPMLDVIGRLEGQVAPDQWVILGNHHDAWIYGAGDPSSGTASLLELARALGTLAAQGLRPRRTVWICFWDAEEMVLGGSTEWVEEHAEELLDKAVAYINMDSAVFNTERPLAVHAHTGLHRLFRTVARDLRDPRSDRSLFEVWRDLQNRYRQVPSVDGWGELFDPGPELSEPYLFETPWDDATPFYYYLAIPASDMYYGADYGMYHSIYENFHWMKTVGDPSFQYHVLMSELQGVVALRLANADVLPLDFVEEARFWRKAYEDLKVICDRRGQRLPRLAEALGLIDRWESEAHGLEADVTALLENPSRRSGLGREVQEINKAIYRAARDFFRRQGRAELPVDRNLFAGNSYDFEGVSGTTLPGPRFALDRGQTEAASKEAAVYVAALRRRVQTLASLRKRLRSVR